jgi:glutamyl-tRNA synthetase
MIVVICPQTNFYNLVFLLLDMDLEKYIYAHALKNAIDYGKTDAGRVLPKLFQHGLAKEKIKETMPQIAKIVKEINSMTKEKREELFKKYAELVPEKEEKEKSLPEIDVSSLKEVITRMAPEPSKYMHIGHAMSFLLNYAYAKKYKGKCYLRLDDANPEKAAQEFVEPILDGLKNYLGIEIDGIKYVSDDMDLLYDYAKKIIKMNKAYMCFCDREKMQDLRHKGIECECRKNSADKNLAEWENFLKGKYLKGEAVLRIKGDMKSQNHVMRDSVIFRAVSAKHYRHGKKYKVWPMYDFYSSIEDSIMGVTLVLRTDEFDLRVELQDYIKDLLGLKKQLIVQYGRIGVADFTTKGRETRELVNSGELIGWDDPRLITLKALRRRGITKEAFYELLNQIGLVKHPVSLEFDMIAAINRKIIDPIANRYFFVQEPVEIEIENMPKIKKVEIPIHPDKKETRTVKVGKIFIQKEDFEKYKGQEIRLLHLFNVRLDKKEPKAVFTSIENKDIQKVQWVSESLPCTVLMPDGNKIKGAAEEGIKRLKKDEVLQFERFGFARLDKTGKVYEFWFTHK